MITRIAGTRASSRPHRRGVAVLNRRPGFLSRCAVVRVASFRYDDKLIPRPRSSRCIARVARAALSHAH